MDSFELHLFSYFKCFFIYNLCNNLVFTLIKNMNYNYDQDRLNYISKNISKSLILIYICIFGYNQVLDALFYNIWDNAFIYQLGILYSSHDILSLFKYYNILSFTTKLHHYSVLILSIANLNIDYTQKTIWRGLIAYAFYSALAFYVNTFLGIRFLIKRDKTYFISKLAFIVYLFSCFINWSFQIYYFYSFYNISYLQTLFFLFLSSFLINDDIVLLKFLYDYE
jgi:hypothetical protein